MTAVHVAVLLAVAAFAAAQKGECIAQDQREILGWRIGSNTQVLARHCVYVSQDIDDYNRYAPLCQPEGYSFESVNLRPSWYTSDSYRTSIRRYVDNVPYTPRTIRYIRKCVLRPYPRGCWSDGRFYAHGSTVTSCGSKCTCSFGRLANCCRQRKSILHMSLTERTRYIAAVSAVSTGAAGAAIKTDYDTLIAEHTSQFFSGIHTSSAFLPWHRSFILDYENILRRYDSCVTVPYWAWELNSADPWSTAPGRLWNSNIFGGGSGNACVSDGPWAWPGWTLTPSEGNTCLRRQRSGSVPTPGDVATLLGIPAASFLSFNSQLDSMHGGVHCTIGGTMCQTYSANAPEFFLHHGNIDRLWAKWQAQSAAHASAFGVPLTTALPSSISGTGYTVGDMMDISDHRGTCVKYVEPRTIIGTISWALIAELAKLPRAAFDTIPITPIRFRSAATKWHDIHMQSEKGLPDEDVKALIETYHRYDYRTPADYDDLPAPDRYLGINITALRDVIAELPYVGNAGLPRGFDYTSYAKNMYNLLDELDDVYEEPTPDDGNCCCGGGARPLPVPLVPRADPPR